MPNVSPPMTWPLERGISQRLEYIFHSCGDNIALIDGDQTISYRELNREIERLSLLLPTTRKDGAVPRVAVCLRRSAKLVTCIVACQMLGADYIPLDPSTPQKRMSHILVSSSPDLVLVDDETEASVAGFEIASRVANIERLPNNPTTLKKCEASVGYVIHTSGSTGIPKGVHLGGEALENLIRWQVGLSSLPANAVTAHFAPVIFDVSFQEIFSTLCTGGTLVVLSNQQRQDPFEFLAEIERCEIQRLFLPFVALQQLVKSALASQNLPSSLVEIHTAGEQLVVSESVRSFFDQLPNCKLFNQYGPSETHVVSCFELPKETKDWERLPSIGTAIPGVKLHILDDNLSPVAAGDQGELCVSGVALAYGYLNNPALTAEKFVEVEITNERFRIYRTGDLATLDDEGLVHFKGRGDDQVKVDGHRVELGEIESVLGDVSGVDAAAVTFDPKMGAGGGLVAFIKGRESNAKRLTSSDLKAFIGERLPEYMVPSKFRILNEFPLTKSGKIDRKALLAQGDDETEKIEKYRSNDMVTAVTSMWRDILQYDELRVSDNIFDKGARSIMVPEFQREMLETFGLKIPVATIFASPTPASLVEFLQRKQTRFSKRNTSIGLLRKHVIPQQDSNRI